MSASSVVKMLSVACVVLSVAGQMQRLGDCSSSADCGPNACCSVGFNRYSVPQCLPHGDLGAWCRVMNQPREFDLVYPNSLHVILRDSYQGFCPCRQGLVCSRSSSTCQQPEESGLPQVNSLFDD